MRALIALGIMVATPAWAQVGPGLGNLTYPAEQVFSPVSFIESPRGHGNVTMVQGYLMVIYSSDGGGNANNGGIEFWNVADPTAPVRVAQYDDANTHGLREAHGFSLAWHQDRLLLAAQGVVGIQIWDVTDPLAITMLSYLDLPGIDRGDYSGDWWLFWQAPYVYVAGVDRGLYVVDASVPAAPALVAQVPTGDIGGVSPAQVFALGNLLVVMETQGSAFATLDISIPEQPRLLRPFTGRSGYSHLFAGDGKILTSGNVPPRAHFFQVTADGDISHLDTVGFFFDSGGYGSYQDGVFHSGFSDDYVKFDIAGASIAGRGSSGRTDRDEDFSTVLGNLVFVGDDHGVGTALIPHQAAPDLSPPLVQWMHPPSGTTGAALTSRIGLSFSDHIDAASLTPATVWLQDENDAVVDVVRSAQMGLVNLSPVAPLGLLRSYTVVVDGVRDLAGNLAPRFEGTITTGDGSIPQSPTAAVANVDVNIALGSYALGIFDEGKTVYSDRNYTFTAQFPARFARQAYLQTANNDKINFLTNFLSFDLLAPAEVLVLYDRRALSPPNWLSAYTPTSETVVTTDATFDVFSRNLAPGPVSLGGNSARGANGADSMYSVVIIPEPVPCAIDLSPVQTGTVTLSAQGPAGGTYQWRVGNLSFADPSPSVYLAPGRHAVTLTVTDGPLAATCGGVKIAHRPLVAQPGRSASRIVWHAQDTINVNPDNGSVTRAGPAGVVWASTGLGRPQTLAVHAGALWVVDGEAARIAVLDLETGAETRSIALPYASAPYGLVVDPDGTAYVTLTATGEVVALAAGGAILRRASGVPTAHGITWFEGQLYVTRFISGAERGEVHVFDAQTLARVQIIGLGFDPGPDTEAGGRGVPNYVSEVRISPDGSAGFVASKKDNIARGLFRDGEPLTFESRVRSIVSVFDPAQNLERLPDRMDINDRDLVQTTLPSPLGDLLFVASQGVNTVDVFDLATHERISQFEVGRAPQGLALDPATGRLAVHNFLARSVGYYDVLGLLSGTSNAVQPLGEVTTVASERLDPLVLSGKRVFYDASDERMSRDSYISCASCHLEGAHDGQTWDFTQAGEGLRNTIDLRGRAGLGHGRVHWTANFDELQDFENDIRNAFGGVGFLSDAAFAATEDPLGPPKAGLAPELDAMAAYVATLDVPPASPHRRSDGALTLEARRGREVFIAAGCPSCHGTAAFTDQARHDVGTIGPASGLGIGAHLAGIGFDTPTLLGLWAGAPYFHDGSASNLAEVIERHGPSPALSGEDEADLIAYLRALDGTSLAPEAPCDQGPNECVEEPVDPPDAGAGDAMPPVGAPDAGSAPDAGAPGPSTPPSEGCSCRADPGDPAATSVGVGLWLGLGLALRRRRRAR